MGGTPLVRLNNITRGIKSVVYVKAEMLNPGGRVKDRIGVAMVAAAEREGKLKPGGTIIEATAGNTGAGLARAATTAVFSLCGVGSPIVLGDDLYGGTYRLAEKIFRKWEISAPYAAIDDPASFEESLTAHTRLTWIESPTNPLRCTSERRGRIGRRIGRRISHTASGPDRVRGKTRRRP